MKHNMITNEMGHARICDTLPLTPCNINAPHWDEEHIGAPTPYASFFDPILYLALFTVSDFIPRFRLRPSPVYKPLSRRLCLSSLTWSLIRVIVLPPSKLRTGLAPGSRMWQWARNKPLSLLSIPPLLDFYKSYSSCPSLTSESSTCPSRTLSRLSTVQSSSDSVCPSHLIHLSTLKRPRSGVGLT